MRNVSRLRLLYFLLFTSLLMCCPLCYSLPCRNYAPPSKAHHLYLKFISKPTHSMLLVEVGGFAPPSRTLFSLLHTAITNIITLFMQLVNQYSIVCFTVSNKIFDVVITFFNEHLWVFRINGNHNYNL